MRILIILSEIEKKGQGGYQFDLEGGLLEFFETQRNIIMPTEENLKPHLPKNDESDCNFNIYRSKPVKISGIQTTVGVIRSKDYPKKIVFFGSDNRKHTFLLKSQKNSIFEREARSMDFFNLVNSLIESSDETRHRALKLRTYNIVPLSHHSGLIEWLDNTATVESVLEEQFNYFKVPATIAVVETEYCADIGGSGKVNKCWDKIVEHHTADVLWEAATQKFPCAQDLFNAKARFTESHAIWCVVGHVLGLEDRHLSNMLLDLGTFEPCQIDFEAIFGYTKTNRAPDRVPFRLTSNIIDLMGVFGTHGSFTTTCEQILKMLKENQDILYVSAFGFDPTTDYEDPQCKNQQNLSEIWNKLNVSGDIPSYIRDIISNATSEDNLMHNYIGWMAWC